jgi:ribonuclease HI
MITGQWTDTSIPDCFKNWRTLNTSYPTLPAFIVWNLWRARNGAIFENWKPSTQKVVKLSLSTMEDYRLPPRKKKFRNITKNPKVKCLAGWFDGAACANGLNSGPGGVIRINENKIYKWYLNYGPGTNTRAELLGAWALLVLAIRFDILEFFVQGDLRIIIDWLTGKGQLHVLTLECWKDRIVELKSHFQAITFQHVYHEDNTEADNLSKIALHRLPGKIEFFQCVGDHEGPHMFLDIF